MTKHQTGRWHRILIASPLHLFEKKGDKSWSREKFRCVPIKLLFVIVFLTYSNAVLGTYRVPLYLTYRIIYIKKVYASVTLLKSCTNAPRDAIYTYIHNTLVYLTESSSHISLRSTEYDPQP